MSNVINRQIFEKLHGATRPLFIADERIDGDCLGSALAMVDYMKTQGKEVPVLLSAPVPDKYSILPHTENCTDDQEILLQEIDLIVTFDCSDEDYVNQYIDQMPRRPFVINIDHHATNSNYGNINHVVTTSPATADVIYHFFKTNTIIPSSEASTCLLAGVVYDTNIFSNEGTNAQAFETSSDLVLHGARVRDVVKMMFSNRSIDVLRLWGIALERLQMHPKHGFVITCLTCKDIESHDIRHEEIGGLTNCLNLITDTDTLFVLCETPDGGVNVSMRSMKYDVAKFARVFGGGGHVKAAGFTLPETKLVVSDDGSWKVEHKELV